MAQLTALLYAINLLLLVSFHVLNRHYSPVSNAVSDYGVGRTARLFRVYVVVGSVAALMLGREVWMASPAVPQAVAWYLVAMAAVRVGVGVFPTDLPGATPTRAGRIHLVFAILTFTLAYMSIAKATPFLAADAPVLRPLHLAAMIGLAAVVVSMKGPLRPYFGLAERLFLFATALWFLVAALSFAGG